MSFIGPIFVELQQAADQTLSRPFPLGASHDKFGLGFQIASSDPKYAKFRSVGSLSWAGIYNTEFWIDPKRHIRGIGVPESPVAKGCATCPGTNSRPRLKLIPSSPLLFESPHTQKWRWGYESRESRVRVAGYTEVSTNL